MKLVIMRHPETNSIAGLSGDPDVPSPEGLVQLSRLIEVCQREEVKGVVHSSLSRVVTPAKALAQALQIPHIVQAELDERDFGDWNNWSWPQIAAKLDTLTLRERYVFTPPNGESWERLEARLRAALQRIVSLGYDSVAIMTHYGAIRALLPIVKNEPRESTLGLEVMNGEIFIQAYNQVTSS